MEARRREGETRKHQSTASLKTKALPDLPSALALRERNCAGVGYSNDRDHGNEQFTSATPTDTQCPLLTIMGQGTGTARDSVF